MPVTKQKLIRHYALDRCFRSRTRQYYIEDLLNECNKDLQRHDCEPVSLRTLKNDLNEFEDIYKEAEIDHIPDGNGRVYYRYSDLRFSIAKAPLNDDELAKLKDTVLMLSRFKGLPQFGWMEEVLTEIQTKLHIEGHTDSVIGFESNEDIKGLEWLNPLFDCIVCRQAVCMRYRPFHGDEILWILHPYYIRQFNNRWFLFALNDADSKIVNVALDRIVSVSPSATKYLPNTDIDFTEYFDDVIGVTIPEGVTAEHILLRFTPNRLPYILSKPLHASQKTKDIDNGIVEITVIPNRELVSLLLSFGDDVEVLQPGHLRQEIREKIAGMSRMYSD